MSQSSTYPKTSKKLQQELLLCPHPLFLFSLSPTPQCHPKCSELLQHHQCNAMQCQNVRPQTSQLRLSSSSFLAKFASLSLHIMGGIGGNELGEWRPYNSAIRKRGDNNTTRGEHEKPSETIPEKYVALKEMERNISGDIIQRNIPSQLCAQTLVVKLIPSNITQIIMDELKRASETIPVKNSSWGKSLLAPF